MRKSDLIPPVLLPMLARFTGREYGYTGNYPTWDAAVAASPPYTTDFSVYAGMINRLKRGEWEPGFTFLVTLAGILLVEEQVNVLDYGGSLGIAYFKSKLTVPEKLSSWHVVDLPKIVQHGCEKYADGVLNFFPTMNDAIAGVKPNMILCGGTLQYLSDPYEKLTEMVAVNAKIIVLDRTPVGAHDRYMVQRVPPILGGMTFPVRLLSKKKINSLMQGYKRIVEHNLGPIDNMPNTSQAQHVAQIWVRDV